MSCMPTLLTWYDTLYLFYCLKVSYDSIVTRIFYLFSVIFIRQLPAHLISNGQFINFFLFNCVHIIFLVRCLCLFAFVY